MSDKNKTLHADAESTRERHFSRRNVLGTTAGLAGVVAFGSAGASAKKHCKCPDDCPHHDAAEEQTKGHVDEPEDDSEESGDEAPEEEESEEEEPEEDIEDIEAQYGTVVDMVEAGADNTGSTPIDGVLDEHRGDDTLLKFPPGTYRMDRQFRFTGFENFGIVGDDATITHGSVRRTDGRSVSSGQFSGPARLFRLGVVHTPGRDLRFQGLEFDFTDDRTGMRAIEAYVETGLTVRNIEINGRHDTGTFGPALFSVTNGSGSGSIDNFRAPDGGAFSRNAPGDISTGPTGVLVPRSHNGTLEFTDCEVSGFPDNGLYVAGAGGRVVVEGGTYENNNVASIRLQGNGSAIRNATVVVDERISERTQRGIRLDSGSNIEVSGTEVTLDEPNGNAITVLNEVESARIHDTSVTVNNRSNPGIVVNPSAGPVEITDSDVEINVSNNALRIRGQNSTSSDDQVVVRNTTITGSASGSSSRIAISCTRANTVFENLTVEQPGDDYRRALEVTADNCQILGGTYETTHIPIIDHATDTTIENATLRSLDGFQGLRLLSSSTRPTVVNNTIYNGIWDSGASNPTIEGNDYP
ncbi:right-handed parallel beta-helix repeat-containing protein (plasmid) [Haloferacaceae archaeon DSL9]